MKKENTVVAAMERGFTLVELLVVVAILGILATVAVSSVTGHIEKTNITAAKTSVRTFDDAIETYASSHHGKLPSDLKDLVKGDKPIVKGGEGALIDPWENPYQLKKEGTKKYYVLSLGPDGVEGSEDDIRSDRITTEKSED